MRCYDEDSNPRRSRSKRTLDQCTSLLTSHPVLVSASSCNCGGPAKMLPPQTADFVPYTALSGLLVSFGGSTSICCALPLVAFSRLPSVRGFRVRIAHDTVVASCTTRMSLRTSLQLPVLPRISNLPSHALVYAGVLKPDSLRARQLWYAPIRLSSCRAIESSPVPF